MMAFDRAAFYDAELQRHRAHFSTALKIRERDCVLDIGCGAGQTTLEAARGAEAGSVVGVDVSEEMLDVARRRSSNEGLSNVTFELGNAQVHDFPAAHFDLCISRFGTMFFADPVVAFANIAHAMRPGARLVMMVWQSCQRNEWAVAIQGALARDSGSSPTASPTFSLADRADTTRILIAAGFASIKFAKVHEPVFYGLSVHAAYDALVGLFLVKDGLANSHLVTDAVHQRLRALLDDHLSADGVRFDSNAWIVTARKA